MRAPPPVEYASALGDAWRAALALLVGAAVAVPLAWGLPYVAAETGSRQSEALFAWLADPAIPPVLALGVGGLVIAAVWLACKSAVTGERTLRWDGQDWVLVGAADGRPDLRGQASLMLDLGPWMLVRFLPHPADAARFGAGTWLPLTLAGDPARWAALRGALWNWRAQGGRRP